MLSVTVNVPCKGCTECCRGPERKLRLLPTAENDLTRYKLTVDDEGVYLANKPNGDCWYLTDEGCGIYDSRPNACRMFDCGQVTKDLGYPLRIRLAGIKANERRGR